MYVVIQAENSMPTIRYMFLYK